MEIIDFKGNLFTWMDKDSEGRKKYACSTSDYAGNLREPINCYHPSKKGAQSLFRYCAHCRRYIRKDDNRDHVKCSKALREA